ncbi:MAG: hypothetical protein ACT4TC_00885 [Myxococcaceae bacterium]
MKIKMFALFLMTGTLGACGLSVAPEGEELDSNEQAVETWPSVETLEREGFVRTETVSVDLPAPQKFHYWCVGSVPGRICYITTTQNPGPRYELIRFEDAARQRVAYATKEGILGPVHLTTIEGEGDGPSQSIVARIEDFVCGGVGRVGCRVSGTLEVRSFESDGSPIGGEVPFSASGASIDEEGQRFVGTATGRYDETLSTASLTVNRQGQPTRWQFTARPGVSSLRPFVTMVGSTSNPNRKWFLGATLAGGPGCHESRGIAVTIEDLDEGRFSLAKVESVVRDSTGLIVASLETGLTQNRRFKEIVTGGAPANSKSWSDWSSNMEIHLRRDGWRPFTVSAGAGYGQPRYSWSFPTKPSCVAQPMLAP